MIMRRMNRLEVKGEKFKLKVQSWKERVRVGNRNFEIELDRWNSVDFIKKTERSVSTNIQSSIFNSGLSGLGIYLNSRG
ncbi:hypothetical protein D1AOALGA4SA_4846 [Olavius algarvensis Delta 1 endosymbiont]|nr:hypothetical protein D1AOALGA4SA_4846 [Olavius algarvensis Delta 1 endosymbiont]